MSTTEMMTTADRSAAAAGILELGTGEGFPREQVEVMEQPHQPTKLWWQVTVNGLHSDWTELEKPAQTYGLLGLLTEPQDTLVLEDDDPLTRYAQVMMIGDGYFHVEIASLQPNGTYNWRVGKGRAADDAPNTPDTGTHELQELRFGETFQVLSSWAAGHGLPLAFGASLHIYGG